jgi:hypothetical protein
MQVVPNRTGYFFARSALVLFFIFTSQFVFAQDSLETGSRAFIIHAGSLCSTYNLRDEPEAVEAIKNIPGITKEEINTLFVYANEDHWPDSLQFSAYRWTKNDIIINYQLYVMTSFTEPTGRKLYILKCPAAENQHMPSGYRISHDIYFVIEAEGVAFYDCLKVRPSK